MSFAKAGVEALLRYRADEAEAVVRAMGERGALTLLREWSGWAHDGQEEPASDWRVWVLLAGRGFGKTRAGAEWVSAFARANGDAAIALVAATADEARRVMVEGRGGLLAVAAAVQEDLLWEPSLGRLTFASGARAFVYSGANPESLRGPEHHIAWCDELAKWAKAGETWTNLQLGLRCGERPRALVTTTPRPVKALKAILGEEGVVTSRGGSADNPHVAPAFVEAMQRLHGGTRLGRQELEGELIEDLEGALWSRDLIEASRKEGALPPEFRRVVVGVDPPAGMDGDACGIVACALGQDGIGYVLGDHSVGGLSPEGWALKVAATAQTHGAHRVVAEANNGGKMVESVLKGAGLKLPVKLVHASADKAGRAAPVLALFESGRARLGGRFAELEEEMCGLCWDGSYHGPGRSPDRADAMVWALTELMLGPEQAEPRIRTL